MFVPITIVLAVCLFLVKLLSEWMLRINWPPVLGMLLVGLLLGPTVLNASAYLGDSGLETMSWLGNIGVAFLMFMAGMETDLRSLSQIGVKAWAIALMGMLVSILGGTLVGKLFLDTWVWGAYAGLVLMSTSVSVSVMSLVDMGKFKTVEGQYILGAAVMDDIMGLVVLTFALSMLSGSGDTGSVAVTLVKVSLYFVGAIIVGVFVPTLFRWASRMRTNLALPTCAFALMLVYAWSAESVGVASITGAYMAGLFIGRTPQKHTIENTFEVLAYAIFVPLFFVNIGLHANLLEPGINWVFALSFGLTAMVTKLFGAALMARLEGFSWNRACRIGSGMIPRGEVSLVVAFFVLQNVGGAAGHHFFTASTVVVLVTVLTAPFIMRFFFVSSRKREQSLGGADA